MALPPAERTAAVRILVALDGAEAALEALSTASFLASRLQAELHGLYVEDIDLLRLAGLPFARTVGHASARPQPFDFASLERAFRQQAERMRTLMEEMADRERLAWSFQVARGRLMDAMMGQSGSADLLVFCRPLALRRESTGPVLVLLHREADVTAVLPLAQALAEEGNLLVAAVDGALLETARAWLRQRGVVARFVLWPKSDGAALAARERAKVVMLVSGDGLSGVDGVALDEVGCPVVVLRRSMPPAGP
ncbi:MAG: hypothetical protein AB7U30_11140 [Sulfuricellaceae bacterium]|jgi:nucleotide-binding universal stress UspA family protein